MSASSASAPKRVLSLFVASLLTTGAVALALAGHRPGGLRAARRAPRPPSRPTPCRPCRSTASRGRRPSSATPSTSAATSPAPGRPAPPPGTQETPRSNLLAYDIRTGELITSFAPDLNGQVAGRRRPRPTARGSTSAATSPGRRPAPQPGRRLRHRHRRARDRLQPERQQPGAGARRDHGTVYLGGSITAVGAVSRTRLAAVTAADGALLPWAPVPGVGRPPATATATRDQRRMALVVTSGGTQVVAAGRFDSMNGVKATGVARARRRHRRDPARSRSTS